MTTKATEAAQEALSTFEESAERVRALNESFIEAAKKSGATSLDSYEKALQSLVDFQKQVAATTELDWVNTIVKAQTDFVTEISAAYTSAARSFLK